MEGQGDLHAKITEISEQLLVGEAPPQDERREEEPLESEAQSSESDDSGTEAESTAAPEGEAPSAEEIRTIAELANCTACA